MAFIEQSVRAELSEAVARRESDMVEAALTHTLALRCPLSAYFDLACGLLIEDWHISHEWLIGEFQDAEDPRAIPFLQQAIDLKPRLQYLDYDDYGSYYKKCLWALKAIGTPEAISVIRDCANSEIRELQEEARYRLSKI